MPRGSEGLRWVGDRAETGGMERRGGAEEWGGFQRVGRRNGEGASIILVLLESMSLLILKKKGT